jgi:hypothetical protein
MNPENQIATAQPQAHELSAPSSLSILERAIQGGVTSENVAVVKELLAMRREETAAANKADFNRAFFRLKTEISTMDFYADKTATTKSGAPAYSYCSEGEISEKLEPVLFKHGFAMMFGQKQDGDRVVVEVTLMHESGHEEKREYSVRTGSTNAMKDATAADSGATTSAWRHLVIKLFGLKSRIKEEGDMANVGGIITFEQSCVLREMVKETNSNEESFLKFAGAETYEKIGSVRYDALFAALDKKRRGAT